MMKKVSFLFLILSVSVCQAQVPKANYDEAKVPIYSLPRILQATPPNRDQWEQKRRPEVLQLFEDNIYGQWPERYDSLTSVISNYQESAMNGKAEMMEVEIEVFNQNKSLKINLVLFVPVAVNSAPVFLLINNRGKENTDPTRKSKSEFWPAEMLVDSGYAIAAFHVSDLSPDDQKHFTEGVLRLYPDQLEAENGMRAIGAWAWGASRVMDYFETLPKIDKNKVVVIGHSRGGKASLWAAAHDQRFAICISNCSGNTGAALARRQFGERIASINTTFPHWFTPNYKKYNNRENDLPVDQHMLIALMAPRPVYATSASADLWADPKGTYLALKNAESVFDLYGLTTGLPKQMPPINTPYINSSIGYHNRDGEHNLTAYDWINFIRFADYHFRIKR